MSFASSRLILSVVAWDLACGCLPSRWLGVLSRWVLALRRVGRSLLLVGFCWGFLRYGSLPIIFHKVVLADSHDLVRVVSTLDAFSCFRVGIVALRCRRDLVGSICLRYWLLDFLTFLRGR